MYSFILQHKDFYDTYTVGFVDLAAIFSQCEILQCTKEHIRRMMLGRGSSSLPTRGKNRSQPSEGSNTASRPETSPVEDEDYAAHRRYSEKSIYASSISSEASSPSQREPGPTASDPTGEPRLMSSSTSGIQRGNVRANSNVWIAPKEAEKIHRRRGRPRKEPSSSQDEARRETKNRTKTGCVTCRKRKKKCTEEKPACQSCKKNSYVCVYPEPEVYMTGKEKAEEGEYR